MISILWRPGRLEFVIEFVGCRQKLFRVFVRDLILRVTEYLRILRVTCNFNESFIKEHCNDAKKKHIFFVADLLYTGICV